MARHGRDHSSSKRCSRCPRVCSLVLARLPVRHVVGDLPAPPPPAPAVVSALGCVRESSIDESSRRAAATITAVAASLPSPPLLALRRRLRPVREELGALDCDDVLLALEQRGHLVDVAQPALEPREPRVDNLAHERVHLPDLSRSRGGG